MNLFPRALLAVLRFDDESIGGNAGRPPGPPSAFSPSLAFLKVLQGLGVGLLEAGVYMLASTLLPTSVALILGLAVGWIAQRPRTPTAILLLLRFEALANLEASWTVAALISSAAWSQACVGLIELTRPASAFPGVHRSTRRRITDALLTALLGLAPAALLARWTGESVAVATACGLAFVLTAVLRRILRERLARRDATEALGSIQAVAQIGMVLGLLALATNGLADSGAADPSEDGEEIP